MDKNKTGKNPSPVRDDMELKALLNASFDKDNLTVSEDLIQRTLLKIKEAEAEDKKNTDSIAAERPVGSEESAERESNGDRKPVIKFPVRRFAGAAAAVLLLVSAVWIYQNNITGTKQDNAGNEQKEQQNFTMAAPESSAVQGIEENEAASTAKEAPLEGDASIGITSSENAADTAKAADTKSSMVTLVAPEVLSELYPINAEEVVTFQVIKAKGKQTEAEQKSLKEPAMKAAELYSLLAAYTVQVSETVETDILYGYEITTQDENVITFEFYPETVKVTDGRLAGKTDTYTINEQAELLKKLAEFTTK
ncbi:MAG: hypothetical protein K0R05_88 [Anaerocolumna sp.]|jgi:hypothetical protein|nr:hypothetical protein [Anaerocolumna sp.]